MIAKDIVSNLLPPLKTSDTGEKALLWMHEFGVNHMPIVNNEQYLGIITEDDILDMSEPLAPIGSYELSLSKPSVNERIHIYEVIRIVVDQKLTLLPVVDDKENYMGVISLDLILKYFASVSAITESGGIIILELSKKQYSLSEIARIVESEDAIVLSAYVNSTQDNSMLEVTLKLNTPDIRAIVASLERYEYVIKGSYQENEYLGELKDRFDSLMNYLNI
ncbi:MAG: CBS domain-containing protein [Chitinophagales bacterium]|nr:CBS domain-containing protein [Chitinophagales bacterium]